MVLRAASRARAALMRRRPGELRAETYLRAFPGLLHMCGCQGLATKPKQLAAAPGIPSLACTQRRLCKTTFVNQAHRKPLPWLNMALARCRRR